MLRQVVTWAFSVGQNSGVPPEETLEETLSVCPDLGALYFHDLNKNHFSSKPSYNFSSAPENDDHINRRLPFSVLQFGKLACTTIPVYNVYIIITTRLSCMKVGEFAGSFVCFWLSSVIFFSMDPISCLLPVCHRIAILAIYAFSFFLRLQPVSCLDTSS